MAAPTEITAAQLARLIGTPEAPIMLDLCLDADFALVPRLIPGARRAWHGDMDTMARALAGRRVVAVCQKGRKISQGAAALLRSRGIAAESLAGGTMDWAAAGLPMVPLDAIPARRDDGATLWVTRQRPKVERIACPWLIRRFVDPDARFLFVAPAEVADVAQRFGATAFDAPGAPFTHDGDACTFDAMLAAFGLETGPLLTLATIVRGADTDRLDLAPQCAGLLAASLGLSRMYRDDLAQLEEGFPLYDMFYRWVRDAGAEIHDWMPEADA